jgi:hypothetical protein
MNSEGLGPDCPQSKKRKTTEYSQRCIIHFRNCKGGHFTHILKLPNAQKRIEKILEVKSKRQSQTSPTERLDKICSQIPDTV